MALKAGRVGVRPDQVDPYGRVSPTDMYVDNLFISDELELQNGADFGTNAKAKINDAVSPMFDEVATDDIMSKTLVGEGEEAQAVELASFNSTDNHWHLSNTKVDDTLTIDGELEIGTNGDFGAKAQSEIANISKATLLWTNPSITSDFTAQTISLNLSSYSRVLIYSIYKKTSGTIYTISTIGDVGIRVIAQSIDYGDNSNLRLLVRDYDVVSNAVICSTGYKWITGSSASTDAGVMIPYKIYGIK